ncbi:hypothetical protein Hanom_Chr16g01514751 [Helianthus anomalus]
MCRLWFTTIGVSASLQLIKPVSARRSRTYFFWQMKIPRLDLKTSIPRKYLRFPRSFISNFENKLFSSRAISSTSFPVIIMSSTYMIRQVTRPFLLLRNRV